MKAADINKQGNIYLGDGANTNFVIVEGNMCGKIHTPFKWCESG